MARGRHAIHRRAVWKAWGVSGRFRIRMAWLFLAASAASCAAVSQLNFLTTADEVAIGRQAAADVERSLPMLKDEAAVSYIDSLGQALVSHSDRRDIDYHFNVVDSKDVNAFALPGGWIYVNAGLIATADHLKCLAEGNGTCRKKSPPGFGHS